MMGNKNDLEIERRFLVRPGFCERDLPKWLEFRVLSILQSYLKKVDGGGNRRVRITHDPQKNTNTYFLTEKSSTANPSVKIEKEREITFEEYKSFSPEEDKGRDAILKRRIIFKWRKQIFELDFFTSPRRINGLAILEIELDSPDQKVELPPFIPIACEVTGSLSNADLSKRPQ